jgi:hypothetical protein
MSYIGKQPTKAPLTASDIEDGIITAAKIEDGAVVAAEIASNAVTTAKINADAVTGAKIADDAINSEHYTDGSVDTAHIADANVTTAKIADDAVTAAKINNDIISGSTELASEPADTDEFLVSDAGTLKRIDYSLIKGGGKILQVVTQQINGVVTVSSQSEVTTGITKAITPTASNSKILVIITGTFAMSVSRATTFCGVGLKRTVGGSETNLQGNGNNDNIANNVFGASNMQMQGTYAYSKEDSPSTTSEVTYTLKSRIETSGEAIRFNNGGMGSFITLMEIGA